MFRVIIPLFHFTTNGDTFVCTGDYLSCKYEINIREYQLEGISADAMLPEHSYSELMEYASEDSKQRLKDIHKHQRHHFTPTKCFLVLDYYQEVGDPNDPTYLYCDTPELGKLREHSLQALRLHATRGAIHYDIYIFNTNRADQRHSSVSSWVSDKFPTLLDSIPFQPSEFTAAEFDSCRRSLQLLLSHSWYKDTQYRRVLKLAISYHWYSLRVERWEHGYMMLAIAFEAMFKADSKEPVNRAIRRLCCILSKSKTEYSQLAASLNDRSITGYSKIRNAIAHGDAAYDYNTIGDAFKMFYPYVRKSIIALLQVSDDTIPESTDYYDSLNSYLEDKFARLPTT